MERKNAWEKYDAIRGLKDSFWIFLKRTGQFISCCKTERECVKEAVRARKGVGATVTFTGCHCQITRHCQPVIKPMRLIRNKAVVLFPHQEKKPYRNGHEHS